MFLHPMSEITALLHEAAAGNHSREQELFDAVYGELRRLASYAMRSERKDHTLQPTALVNEAYIRLVGGSSLNFEGRRHFFNVAAHTMRNILIDHARALIAAKRGAGARKVELDETSSITLDRPEEILSIHAALDKLHGLDERQAKIVELRYFCGLSVEETARLLEISEKTVKRDWAFARAWFEKELRSI
jgi:RNA polymerase sigma-70 factor, ECF subfamily